MAILIFEDQGEEAGRSAGEAATPLVTASMWQQCHIRELPGFDELDRFEEDLSACRSRCNVRPIYRPITIRCKKEDEYSTVGCAAVMSTT